MEVTLANGVKSPEVQLGTFRLRGTTLQVWEIRKVNLTQEPKAFTKPLTLNLDVQLWISSNWLQLIHRGVDGTWSERIDPCVWIRSLLSEYPVYCFLLVRFPPAAWLLFFSSHVPHLHTLCIVFSIQVPTCRLIIMYFQASLTAALEVGYRGVDTAAVYR